MRVLFIASLPKSGSTLLDLLFSSHSRCVGLGEVYQLLRPGSTILERLADPLTACSCGQSMDTCPFWGRLLTPLRQKAASSPVEKYRLIIAAFEREFGAETTLIDSSKDPAALRVLGQLGIELRVVYLLRDVRGWVVSHSDIKESLRQRELRERGFGGSSGASVGAYSCLSAFRLFVEWYSGNRTLKRYLNESSTAYYQVGYEELCAFPEEILARLCSFAGLDPELQMLDLTRTKAHNILGNRMRFQPQKRRGIVYDNRWFRVNYWLPAAVVLPMVMRFSHSEVYRHQELFGMWNE